MRVPRAVTSLAMHLAVPCAATMISLPPHLPTILSPTLQVMLPLHPMILLSRLPSAHPTPHPLSRSVTTSSQLPLPERRHATGRRASPIFDRSTATTHPTSGLHGGIFSQATISAASDRFRPTSSDLFALRPETTTPGSLATSVPSPTPPPSGGCSPTSRCLFWPRPHKMIETKNPSHS